MDSNQSSLQATGDNEKMDKLIRSKYKDVMVKAGEDIFYVDRLKLALKSVYFEKLLVQKWSEQNLDPITIPFDSSTFSTILDVVYNNCSWSSVLTPDNFVSVLEAKDFFHMNQSDYDHSKFISDYLKKTSKSDAKVLKLLNFVTQNGNKPKSSLLKIHKYLHDNLEYFQDREELLSLPLDQFVKMITWDDQPGSRKTDCDQDQIQETCIKWICHDVQNRLPYLVKIANAGLIKIKNMFRIDESCIEMKLSDINEQNKYETVRRYFRRFFNSASGIVIQKGVVARFEDMGRSKKKEDSSDGEKDDSDAEKDDIHEPARKKQKKVEDRKEKLKEYVKNGKFYDITVKVGSKSYKLHRSVLQSNCEYFDKLFSTEYAEAVVHCEGVPDLPDKDKEYVIEGIDEATFDLLVDHIYSGKEIDISSENVIRLFRAADVLGISKLLQNLKKEYRWVDDRLDSKDLLEMLDITRNKIQFKDMYNRCLKTYVSKSWPNVDLMEEFYSISWDTLENWLELRYNFNFDDPEQLLDVCSKWIWHDVKNRYQFIPRAALAIKSYSKPDYEDYKMETPSDLSDCSEQLIRDKIHEILGSTPLLPADTMSKTDRKFDDGPVFITSTQGNGCSIIEIRDANFKPIETLSFYHLSFNSVISATVVKDNIFMCGWNIQFMAYNMPSKKFILLHEDSRLAHDSSGYTLLNCRDEVYSCNEDGFIFKYSFLFNSWMLFSKPESDKKEIRFTSDGKKLYRLYQSSSSGTTYIVEAYDFEQNAWSLLPDLPSPIPSSGTGGRFRSSNSDLPSACGFTIINDCNPAILFKEIVLWLDDKSQTWRSIPLPYNHFWQEPKLPHICVLAIAQGENNKLTYVCANKLHQNNNCSNSNQRWEVKKEMRIPEGFFYMTSNAPYHFVTAINRPVCG